MQWLDTGAISSGLRVNQTLTKLHLNCIEAEVDSALACNSTISSLTLTECHLEDRHEPSISSMLHNGSITYLNLGRNNLGSSGAISLFTTLQSSSVKLEKLLLHGNKLGESKQDTLAAIIEQTLDCNQRLKVLDLEDCSLHSLVVEGIAISLAFNNVLESLSLSGNSITVTGVWQLCTALQVNTCLKKLRLGDSIILDSTTMDQVIQALKFNSTLASLHLEFDACICDANSLQMFVNALQMNSSLTTLRVTGVENLQMDSINFNRLKRNFSILKTV